MFYLLEAVSALQKERMIRLDCPKLKTRISAFLLCLSIAMPCPAFALREMQPGDNAGLEAEVANALGHPQVGQETVRQNATTTAGLEQVPLKKVNPSPRGPKFNDLKKNTSGVAEHLIATCGGPK